MKVIYCAPDQKPELKEIGSTDEIRSLIGGWLELVRPRFLPHPFLMLVDEEGLLKDLPVNLIGSILYGLGSPSPIVGPLVIAAEGIVDGEPDVIGLSDQDAHDLLDRYLPRLVQITLPNGDCL